MLFDDLTYVARWNVQCSFISELLKWDANRLESYILCFVTYSIQLLLLFCFYSIISVKAKSFADREIRYTLKAQGQGAGTFNIGPTSGIVKLAKELDFEDLRQPHVYSLIVTATEDSGGFSTSVEVSISLRFDRHSKFTVLAFKLYWPTFLPIS